MPRRNHARARAAIILTLSATAAGGGDAQWLNTSGGLWSEPTNWSLGLVPMVVGDAAEISIPGIYTVLLDTDPQINGLALTNPDATLTFSNGTALTLGAQGLVNHGLTEIGSPANSMGASLTLASQAELSGPGRIRLRYPDGGDPTLARLSAAPGVFATNSADHTIAGAGQITGVWLNEGLIEADETDTELRISGLILQDASGRISARDSAIVGLDDLTTIIGGTLDATGESVITAINGSSRVDGVHNTGSLAVDRGVTLEIAQGGIINDGSLILTRTVPSNGSASIEFVQNAEISGTGQIILYERGFGSQRDAVLRTGPGVTATIGAGQFVTGLAEFQGDWIINTEIIANPGPIDLDGTFDLTNGGSLRTRGNAEFYIAGTDITGGSLESTEPDGRFILGAHGAATLTDVTNNAHLTIRDETTLDIHGSVFLNTGVLEIQNPFGDDATRVNLHNSVLITGGGTIDISDKSLLEVESQMTATIDDGTLIRAYEGQIVGDWINRGLIHVRLSGSGPFEGSGIFGSIDQTQGGTIELEPSSSLLLSARATGGSINGSPGSTVSYTNMTVLDGITINSNSLVLSNFQTRVAPGGMTNNGTLTINNDRRERSTSLLLEENATIDGTGRIVLNGPDFGSNFYSRIVTGSATLGPGQTVEGQGEIFGTWNIDGAVIANRPGQWLTMDGRFTMGPGAELIADNTALVFSGNSTTLSGGIMSTHNEGEICFRADQLSDAINNGTLIIEGYTLLTGTPGLVNNASLSIHRPTSTGNSALVASEPSAITGTGTILLARDSRSTLGSLQDAALTVGPGQTITGHGTIQGTVLIQGAIDPGPGTNLIKLGTHAVDGSVTLDAGALVRVGLEASGDSDEFWIQGPTHLDGTLSLTLVDGAAPTLPTSYEIFYSPSDNPPPLTGEFADIILENPPSAGIAARAQYTPSSLTITLVCVADLAEPLGTIDLADIVAFVNAFTTSDPAADLDGSGAFDLEDITLFVAAFLAGCE